MSIDSNLAKSNVTGDGQRTSTRVVEYSTEKTVAGDPKSSTTTSAFQRLVLASKRMIQKKSSEKKDPIKSSKLVVEMQARSNS